MRKKMFIGGIIIVSLLLVAGGFDIRNKLDERASAVTEYEREVDALKEEEKNARGLFNELRESKTPEELKNLQNKADTLPALAREVFRSAAQGKEAEARFDEQERLLLKTNALLNVNENDATAKRYLTEAEELHEQNMKFISELMEINGNCQWNSAIHYLKGLVYFRGLVFIKKDEKTKAQDLVEKSLKSFIEVFKCAPKDNDAETAIEILYKKAEKAGLLEPGSEKGADISPEFLPPAPDNAAPGTGGRNRERGKH